MYYHVKTMDSNFTIPAENLADSYSAMCALNSGREISNLESNYDEIYNNSQEIFEALGFSSYTFSNGDLILSSFNGDQGDIELFLESVAPYAKDGCYIQWMDDDVYLWKNEFSNGEMHTQYGRVIWE